LRLWGILRSIVKEGKRTLLEIRLKKSGVFYREE
jgi:hypothetical protein